MKFLTQINLSPASQSIMCFELYSPVCTDRGFLCFKTRDPYSLCNIYLCAFATFPRLLLSLHTFHPLFNFENLNLF